MDQSAELVLIPYASRGHITAMLEFAKLVVDRTDRISVTVLIAKLPLDVSLANYVDALVASLAPSPRINFVAIDNETFNTDDITNPIVFMRRFVESLKRPVRNYVNDTGLASGRPLTGFVLDMMMTPIADVADELGAPAYVFWVSSAGFLCIGQQLMQIQDRIEEHGNTRSFDVPGFHYPVPAHALSPALFDEASAAIVLETFTRTSKARGVIVNTSTEIEPHPIGYLTSSGAKYPPVYPVGPVLSLKDDTSSEAFSALDDANIMKWLDGQPVSSVIFLCFGSIGSFGADQVKEIAFALERTGFRFLWTLRNPPKDKRASASEVCGDPAAILPEGFLERTGDVGRIIGWAPQVVVLAHPAVGGFVSHCGWNSVLESLWFGVPIATWPLYAEHQLHAFEMLTELGLAEEIRADYRAGFDSGINADEAPLVSSAEIEAGMRSVMEGESEVRKRVKETSDKCRNAVTEGGSSLTSLNRFVSDVFENFQLD